MQNLSLKQIIQTAYGVQDPQFVGPAWLAVTGKQAAIRPIISFFICDSRIL